jgi:uncharacterized protein YndB with AHSA1/START domain
MKVAMAVVGVACAMAAADDRILRVETVVDAPVRDVWKAYTTKEGWESWAVPLAEVDFRVGGMIRTNYNKEAGIGGPGTITHHILAYEPERMVVTRFEAPANAAWAKKAEACRVVVRLEPVSGSRTRFVETMVGFGEGPEWDEAYNKFKAGNERTLEQLRKKFGKGNAAMEARPIDPALFPASGMVGGGLVKETVVKATPEEVFRSWATAEGLKSFLGVDAKVELRVGGAFELYFGGDALPFEQRGSVGCQVLSYVPDEMISFSWNAPPKFPAERAQRAWVVVTMRPEGDGQTRVRLVHTGFGEGGRWEQVRAYFDSAWTNVLGALKGKFEKE